MPRASRTLHPVDVHFPPLGLVALESRHARGFSMPAMRHEYLKILIPFQGEGRLRCTSGDLPVRPGEVLAVPPGCEHWLEDVRPLSLYAVCFRAPEFSEGWPPGICRSGRPRALVDPASEWPGWARELLHEQTVPSSGSSSMLRAVGWRMLGWLTRTSEVVRSEVVAGSSSASDRTGSRARVQAAEVELRRRFHEPLTIDQAAHRAGLSRRRFTQLFREVHGRTWWETLLKARLDHAERLLRRGERSVTAVAFECGFGDLSGFYRAWSSRHTRSPLTWRGSETGDPPHQP